MVIAICDTIAPITVPIILPFTPSKKLCFKNISFTCFPDAPTTLNTAIDLYFSLIDTDKIFIILTAEIKFIITARTTTKIEIYENHLDNISKTSCLDATIVVKHFCNTLT